MRHILVYGDSLSWGIVPNTRVRLPFEERWPGILEARLNEGAEEKVRVVEDCLNGRRTVWEDPFKAGRNGFEGLAQRMEVNSPLALVIVMLGSNDFQFCHPYNNAWSAAQGVARLVKTMREAPIEPGMAVPPVLVICPPQSGVARGSMTEKFAGADARSVGLVEAYRQMAEEMGCGFFDAGSVVRVSKLDGVHLDAEEHPKLAVGLAGIVAGMLKEGPSV